MDRGGGGGGGGRENSKIRRERLRLRGERKRLVGERGGGATRSVSEGKLASRMADADYESSTSRQPRPVRAATSYTWTRARCEPSRCEMHATLHLRCHQPASPDHVHDLPLLSPFPPRRSITRQSLSINERTLREPPERNFRDIRLSLARTPPPRVAFQTLIDTNATFRDYQYRTPTPTRILAPIHRSIWNNNG